MEKKFVLTVTEGSDGCVRIETENSGFNLLEIFGILKAKEHDLFKQMEQPAEFVRKLIKKDGTELIIDKEDDEQ